MKTIFFRKRSLALVWLLILAATASFSELPVRLNKDSDNTYSLYKELKLSDIGLGQMVFEKAISGWKLLHNKLSNPGMLSIVDLTQSSNAKRLYVIDIQKKKVLFNTYVAHGRNSGDEFANYFANEPESYKSSLGFYLTGNVYHGGHGTSLKLVGVEKGINDCAEKRGIVMHGAPYVSESFIKHYGRLGRSQGCPAVSENDCLPIISSIKEGSCFFIYYPDSNYYKKSVIL